MVWARIRVTHWGGGLGAPRYTGTRLWSIQQSTSPGLSYNCARHARLRPKWSVRGIDRCAQGCVSSRREGRRTSGESTICCYRYIKHHILCCPRAFHQLIWLLWIPSSVLLWNSWQILLTLFMFIHQGIIFVWCESKFTEVYYRQKMFWTRNISDHYLHSILFLTLRKDSMKVFLNLKKHRFHVILKRI